MDQCRTTPCTELNGDIHPKCGLCKGMHFLCRPGVPGFPSHTKAPAGDMRAPTFVAEREVTITSGSSDKLHQLRYEAGWKECFLAARVYVHDGDMTAPNVVRRAVATLPVTSTDDERSTCIGKGFHDAELSITAGSTNSINLANEPNACEEMGRSKATNAVHIKYFLLQQKAEAEFLEAAERALCNEEPPEATFQQRLHSLLKPVRMAVRLHIMMAFYAKRDCTHNTAIDRQCAITQTQLLQLPTYAAGYFHLKHVPGQLFWQKQAGVP